MTGAGVGLEGVILEGVRAEALVPRGVSAVEDMVALIPKIVTSTPLQRTLARMPKTGSLVSFRGRSLRFLLG